MALVAYDYGSESEEETVENDEQTKVITVQNEERSEGAHVPSVNTNVNIFSKLPESKSSLEDLEEDQIEDFIPKSKEVKEKQKVKITIPSLSQFQDDDDDTGEPENKKLKQQSKGCGLISLLPPVKGTVKTAKSFVPHVVANKSKTVPIAATSSVSKTTIAKRPPEVKKPNFLSLSDVESDDEIDVPDTFDDKMWEKVCGRQKKKKPVLRRPEPVPEETVDIAPEPEKPYDGLDNVAFKELVGKTRRPIGNIKLIDINEEEILPDKDIWMAKSLTDPELAPKPEVEDPVDPTKRKKHHITYLAQQAKANEQELANAWAASKNNRLMSRAKYGF